MRETVRKRQQPPHERPPHEQHPYQARQSPARTPQSSVAESIHSGRAGHTRGEHTGDEHTGSAAAPERTKRRLLELLKRHSKLSAQALAQQLGISYTAVRRHLSDLLGQHMVACYTERPGGRGRPQQMYTLSDKGEASFPKTYASLCIDVLRQVEQLFGESAVRRVFDGRNTELQQRLEAELPAHLPLEIRLERLASCLSQLGFDAVLEPYPAGAQELALVQRNCPSLSVARQFQSLCDAEQTLYENLLGRPLQRENTMACGHGSCRYIFGQA